LTETVKLMINISTFCSAARTVQITTISGAQ